MYYVYILHSEKDGKLYTGSTPDLRLRIDKHRRGFILSTKNRRPLKLIYYESYIEKSDALKREKFLKGGNGKKNLEEQLKNYFDKHEWNK